MTDTKLAQLSRMPLFADLCPRGLLEMGRILDLSHVPPGSVVQSEGKRCRWWTLIVEGTAMVCMGESPLRMLGPGDSFDVRSIVRRERCSYSVTALSEMTLLVTDARGLGYLAMRLGLFEEVRAVQQRRTASRESHDTTPHQVRDVEPGDKATDVTSPRGVSRATRA